MIRTVELPTKGIVDWNSFHATLQKALAFPDFYGRNGNAFIDCLIYDDDMMSVVPPRPGGPMPQIRVSDYIRLRFDEVIEREELWPDGISK